MRLLAFQVVVACFGCVSADTCDLGIVGAGPGGAYAAWHAAKSGRSVCVFELAGRPGGRVHSLRGQGPQGNLVVEAGAYRFAPKTVYAKIRNFTWKISTPLTAAIVKELQLPTAIYNPNASEWDHGMHKIVDETGNDVGFLTFVELMMGLAEKAGAKIRYNTTVVSLSGKSSRGPVGLRLSSGEVVSVNSVILNLPQHPVIELLRNSDSAIASVFPRPLYVPISAPLMKLYVHYDDAWWRNDLGLVSGAFFNTEMHPNQTTPDPQPNQMPTPLAGSYHDGDVRCDDKGRHCSGYFQAYYGSTKAHHTGGIDGGLGFYAAYHDSVTDDSVAHITPSKAHHQELLSEVHASMVEFHRAKLDAVNATARVSQMRPTGAVLSIWSQGVRGIHGGCHEPKGGKNPSPEDLPTAALQPLPGWPIFVANEAFGHMHCFAEGSLAMSDALMKRMNITTMSWQANEVDPTHPETRDAPLVSGDPFFMPGGAYLRPFTSGSKSTII